MMKLLAAAGLAAVPLLAHATCLPVSGSVELAPDPGCMIVSQVPGVNFTGECFKVALSLFGLPAGSGHAGVTRETVLGADGVPTHTPVLIPEAAAAPLPRQIVQTARSTLAIGSGALRTTLYSSDVTVIRPQLSATGQVLPAAVTEQILITGTDGRGMFAGVSGHLAVLGNSIGQKARVIGEICRK